MSAARIFKIVLLKKFKDQKPHLADVFLTVDDSFVMAFSNHYHKTVSHLQKWCWYQIYRSMD